MNEVKLTRKELYNIVWSEPMLKLSKKYCISDTGLRKLCVKMDIPLPKAGHWAKLKYGKSVTVKTLPKEYTGDEEVILLPRKKGEDNSVHQSPLNILKKEIEDDPSLSLTVPARLSSPDNLIVSAKKALNSKDKGFDGWVTCKYEGLDISVSPKTIGRAPRIMDTFIKLIQARNHQIRLKYGETYLVVEGEEIQISMREKRKRTMVEGKYYSEAQYSLTGMLYIKMGPSYRPTEWTDVKQPLENQLSKILARVELEGKELKAWRLQCETDRKEREKQRQIQQELEQRKERELSDFKMLLQKVQRWQEAKMLRDYIDAVEADVAVNNVISEDLGNWFIWARKKADWYDPLIEAEDELLKEVIGKF
ncbi:MAG: hypothetical protein JKY33_09480 [Bacteroidia bacterium]|nr:hypothetical protein [Bacteroidia bacterium]